MDSIERLIALFERFPGIGPRQAQRFVHYLLRSSPSLRRELVDSISSLHGSVRECVQCGRFYAEDSARTATRCGICLDSARARHQICVVASDADVHAIERSHTYDGQYLVLGGTIALSSERLDHLRVPLLRERVSELSKEGALEVILALPANPEGDTTAARIREEIESMPAIQITMLGRGLSTGSELEYADPETIRAALTSRK